MPTVQPSPSPVLTPTANRVGCEREVATSVLAANHNRGWSVPGTREQSEIPRATGVKYGARSCQGSMYQAESLIAPKALLAKLLLWNVTLPRYPMVRRKPRFLPLYLLSRPFEHPRISFPLWLYVIDFLLSFSLSFSLSLFLSSDWNHFDAQIHIYNTIVNTHAKRFDTSLLTKNIIAILVLRIQNFVHHDWLVYIF